MPEHNRVERSVLAALEREPAINLHRFPIRLEYDVANRVLTLDGEVGSIAAKRRAYLVASEAPQIDGIIDRLRVVPAKRHGDGAITATLSEALLGEPALRNASVRVRRKGGMEALRDAAAQDGAIELAVEDGVVELTGHVASLSHKRLAGVLAWWAPGSRDVVNELQIRPPEQDNDGEIADAMRLVLEKDPLVHADQIAVWVKDRTVRLTGYVATEEERRMAESDAWYLTGVDNVINEISVRR